MLTIAWSSVYHHPLPANHRFPMEKYSLLPQQLIYEGTADLESFFAPIPVSEQNILRVHSAAYWGKLKSCAFTRAEERQSGFPMSPELVHRERVIAAGTLQNALNALKFGCSFNIAGGTHHAYSDKAAGFCLLNDIAIAAGFLLNQSLVKKILVVDLDVHQGNGTAQIFQNEPRVFTFSMHGAHNYPLHKELSDLDIPLPDGTSDQEYLAILNLNLDALLADIRPEFIFFQAGVDVLQSDKLGRLGLSVAGCKARDLSVFSKANSLGIPIAVSMGGGYSEDIRIIIEAHANTFRVARQVFF
jgi:acetoin utilization deacetylase AcuC-like enzyme